MSFPQRFYLWLWAARPEEEPGHQRIGWLHLLLLLVPVLGPAMFMSAGDEDW